MAEGRWLDNLSEDWPSSENRSLTSSLLSPSGTSQRSRIPRLSSGPLSSLPKHPTKSRTVSIADDSRRRVLAERKNGSNSQVAIAPQPSTRDGKSAHVKSLSSGGSVVYNGSVVQHGKSPSPQKSGKDQTAPEWRELVMGARGDASSQHDLFRGKDEIEGIFDRPHTPSDSSVISQKPDGVFALLANTSYMPSSPPPWSHTHLNARLSTRTGGGNASPPHQASRIEELQAAASSSASQLSTSHHGSAPEAHPVADTSIASRHPSSVDTSNDFSPVYISKHATVDGRVDYAPLDMSNSDVVDRIQQMSKHPSRSPSKEPCQSFHTSAVPSRQVSQSTALQPLNSFVNTTRGSEKGHESFLNRPLSPSPTSSSQLPSESVGPFDSVSQVGRMTSVTSSQLPLLQNGIAQEGANISTQQTATVKSAQGSSASEMSADNPAALSPRLARPGTSDEGNVEPIATLEKDLAPERERSIRDLVTPDLQIHQGSPTKRQIPTPSQSTPKRQRGYDAPPIQTNASLAAHSSRLSSVIGHKRKDARYDTAQPLIDAASLAMRQIARPRNPTPGASKARADLILTSDLASEILASEELSDHSEPDSSSSFHRGHVEIGAQGPKPINMQRRVSSVVDTNDFTGVANRLMAMIRAKDLASRQAAAVDRIDEVTGELTQSTKPDFTPQQFERPPSREGVVSRWRTQNIEEFAPEALEQLERYQERPKDDFFLDSIIASSQASPRTQSINRPMTRQTRDISDPPNIRILEPQNRRRHSDPPAPGVIPIIVRPAEDTRTVGQLTNSSAGTTSTQRSRLPLIGPDKVTHLIKAQERTAGMRFDSEKLTWIRCKRPITGLTDNPSSSIATEEDPLAHIPDLSVNEMDECQRQQYLKSQQEPHDHDLSGVEVADMFEEEVHENEDMLSHPYLDGSDEIPENSFTIQYDGQKDTKGELDKEDGMAYIEADDYDSTLPLPERRIPVTTRSYPSCLTSFGTTKSRRNDLAVTFSSPPVSRHHDAAQFSDQTQITDDARAYAENFVNPSVKPSRPEATTGIEVISRNEPLPDRRAISMPQLRDFELSMTSARPNGRAMSFTLSVSTPLPRASGSSSFLKAHLETVARRNLYMQSLSPMSEFTVHQDDRKHLQSQNLLPLQKRRLISYSNSAWTALSHNHLVETLTAAEPEEVYWDTVTSLDLQNTHLDNLHLLDEFCPMLQTLDVSDNELRQIEGAPSSIRDLRLAGNQLTSLTDWTPFRNIQYLDVSKNQLGDLRAFSHLVHLRDLKAENNQIMSLDGILDLDALLSLSLSGNEIADVDFRGATLNRLGALDLSRNMLSDIRGLDCLPAIRALNISNNVLKELYEPCNEAVPMLEELDVSINDLQVLDISMFPNLKVLDADDNLLDRLHVPAYCSALSIVSLRKQALDTAFDLVGLHNITELYLSDTPLKVVFDFPTPFLNLQVLDASFTGIQILSERFFEMAPNLRALNFNNNSIRDLRPLAYIQRLRTLHVAGNRIQRMRRLVKVLATLPELEVLDTRENPVCNGLYASLSSSTSGSERTLPVSSRHSKSLFHLLPTAENVLDDKHIARMDEETSLRRRTYELLVAAKCYKLKQLDGLVLERARIAKRDQTWDTLVDLGVIEQR